MPTPQTRRRRRAAFTIAEVLVVVVIIAVLATLIAPKLWSRIGTARHGVATQNVAEIEKAIDMFVTDYGRLPEALDELVHRPADIDEADWTPPSLKAKNLTDPWGRPYLYRAPGEHGPFDLYSLGADGQDGGEKDNADITNWE